MAPLWWISFALAATAVTADTPANCTLEDVLGEWTFYEGKVSSNPNLDCTQIPTVHRKIAVTLTEDYAFESNWTRGPWTLIYNQGFQVFLNFRDFFAFFQYRQDGKNVTSLCGQTFVGRSHDVTLRNYACFFAKKNEKVEAKVHEHPFYEHPLLNARQYTRRAHEKLVDEVNRKQNNWTAQVHEPFVGMTPKELIHTAGGPSSWLPFRPNAQPKTYDDLDTFDWRNVTGQNFLSPVRNQGACGSCYAFSSVGMMEARLRLYTRNQQQPILSPQDIVSCTNLAQGCSGGFPYLIAGKYGWEKGLVPESCNPYDGQDEMCIKEDCKRWYTASYAYVGGQYGRCSEAAMIASLRNGGPLSVSFNVYPDFMHYKSGIYHYTGPTASFSQFIPVNHAVLLVGYGVDAATGEKFWTVKNSWGAEWGENGYFRIRRGTDEVGIESIAVEAFPIPV